MIQEDAQKHGVFIVPCLSDSKLEIVGIETEKLSGFRSCVLPQL
jgi:hypothetical protein